MKKQLLIVAHHMTVGGVQKTLISASKALDYDKYDVTLYLRKNRTDLLEFVDERINVTVNKDPHHYYRKPYAVALQLKIMLNKLFGRKTAASALERELADRIREDAMEYEQKTYFSSKKYDIAVAYVQGYTSLFVDKYIQADEKIVFYHTSTDDQHDMHELVLPGFDKIAALHEEQKKLLCKWYPRHADKISVVENFTDKEMITAQSTEKKINVPEGKTVLCSCGRFARVKGFDLAVNSAKILRDNGVDFVWYFVGDGPEKGKLTEMIEEYRLSDNIIITGMQKNPYPYMAACDIYIQPSYEEAVGLTVLEAHRLNKPVVSTATVGGKKLIQNGKNGVLCEIGSRAITEAVEKLINDKESRAEIVGNLEKTDYSEEFEKYKEQWKALLEG